ncbi:hypothetical protein [Thalassobacillus devorans]|uniref:hypothetical protein n=1 Tax=Thalassobacillus devorans TaxID=279813 RepID=UPI000A1CB9D2|nr:hypothetical protein [Thalassobacillus devorans]
MLSFNEKISIIEEFPQLTRKEVSLGRVNYHYYPSVYDKTVVVYHLHPNGNGFVYTGQLSEYDADSKGLVNIRNYTENQLRDIITAAIGNLSTDAEISHEQTWTGPDNQSLLLVQEDYFWNIYTGEMLEESFETYNEAEAYLKEEGFIKT